MQVYMVASLYQLHNGGKQFSSSTHSLVTIHINNSIAHYSLLFDAVVPHGLEAISIPAFVPLLRFQLASIDLRSMYLQCSSWTRYILDPCALAQQFGLPNCSPFYICFMGLLEHIYCCRLISSVFVEIAC